jgi:branched-subunit amino acid aminotransferase/4-amino-4-deoxychorismate lyase
VFEVFTTVLVQHDKPLWLKEHLARLELHGRLAGFKIPPAPHLQKIDGTCLLRISLNQNGYEFKTRPYVQPPTGPVKIYVSDQIATSQIKTNQREAYDLAYGQAQEHSAFEGLLCNQDGYLVDGSRSSLLMLKDKTLTILEGGIEGITRQQVVLRAQTLGFKIKRAYLKPSEIDGQLFIAGTGIGLLQIQE